MGIHIIHVEAIHHWGLECDATVVAVSDDAVPFSASLNGFSSDKGFSASGKGFDFFDPRTPPTSPPRAAAMAKNTMTAMS